MNTYKIQENTSANGRWALAIAKTDDHPIIVKTLKAKSGKELDDLINTVTSGFEALGFAKE
jgi:hypothetical protein